MIIVIAGIILLLSVKLADNPYRRLWKENLSFDKTVKSELASAYSDKKKAAHILNLTGAALIAIGFFLSLRFADSGGLENGTFSKCNNPL